MNEITPNPPLRHGNQGGTVLAQPFAAELSAYTAELGPRRRYQYGLWAGPRALLVFLQERGLTLETLTAAAFVDFLSALPHRGKHSKQLYAAGARRYLRTRAQRLCDPDLFPQLAPRNYDEQRALYLHHDPSLVAVFDEVEAYVQRRRERSYLALHARVGVLRLLLFLRARAKHVTQMSEADWQAFGASAGDDFLCQARAYARLVPGAQVPLRKPPKRRGWPELPAGLRELPQVLEQAMSACDFSEASRPSYRDALFDFLTWLLAQEGIPDLGSVTRDVITDYKLSLQTRLTLRKRQPYAAATQARHIIGVRFLFSWLFKTGHLLTNPTLHLPNPKLPQTLPRVLRAGQLSQLIAKLPKDRLGLRDRALVELLYGTGLRRSELAHLTLDDMDLQAQTIHVRQGKGQKDRVVPLGNKAKEALLDYLDLSRVALVHGGTTPAVFVSMTGRPFTPNQVTRTVSRLGSRHGLKLWPHLLRHACATHLLRGRADIRHIQRLLGHKSLSSTERYTRVEVTDLKRVIARCHPREKPPRP